jgi:hypothetical protein
MTTDFILNGTTSYVVSGTVTSIEAVGAGAHAVSVLGGGYGVAVANIAKF